MAPTITRGELASADERRAMVENQIRTFDVTDQRVQAAFNLIPRELFLPPEYTALAYSDAALAVRGEGATRRMLLVPMVLARMLQGLALEVTDRALVVASGTGYAACLVAELCASVVALEADAGLSAKTKANAETLGLGSIETVTGSLADGHAAGAPYDVILICGAVERKPETLFGQLAPNGRLVAIQTESAAGVRYAGKVMRSERIGTDISSRFLFDAASAVLDDFRQPTGFVF